MLITITDESLFVADGSVATVTGTDEQGREVTFGGDWRPMMELKFAAAEHGEVQAEVEDWQILGRSR